MALKQPVHKVMEQLVVSKGVEKAVEEYRIMKKDTAHYYIDWYAMDQVGSQLFNLKRYDEARVIFEHNASEFPERDWVMLSLANTYAILGREKDAVKYYQKTVLLNPKNEEAKNRLKELESKK